MSAKNEKKVLIPEKHSSLFMITCTFFGAILGSLLVYFIQGEFPYEVLAGGSAAIIILIIIEVIKKKSKKDNVPEVDERVTHNIFNFFAYGSHIFMAILIIGIAVFTMMGNETMPLVYLWIFAFAYIWIVGIGALVVKRR